MKPTIEKGRALVLYGPQGCGKSKLAVELAKAHGSYTEVHRADIDGGALTPWLAGEPRTCIVDGFPSTELGMNALKQMITTEMAVLRLRGREPRAIPAPNFIFCVDDIDPLPMSDRRFNVVRMQA